MYSGLLGIYWLQDEGSKDCLKHLCDVHTKIGFVCLYTAAIEKHPFLYCILKDGIGEEVLKMSTEEIVQRTRLLDSEIKVM